MFLQNSQEKIEEVAKQLNEEFGVETYPIRCDITDTEMVDDTVAKVMEKYGRIDILVNNAGTGAVAPAEDITDDQFSMKWISICSVPSRLLVRLLSRQ